MNSGLNMAYPNLAWEWSFIKVMMICQEKKLRLLKLNLQAVPFFCSFAGSAWLVWSTLLSIFPLLSSAIYESRQHWDSILANAKNQTLDSWVRSKNSNSVLFRIPSCSPLLVNPSELMQYLLLILKLWNSSLI